MTTVAVRPLRIGLDGTCVCHGSRAIRRYVVNLVRVLLRLRSAHEFRLLRVNPTSTAVLSGLRDAGLKLRDVPIPARILYPLWQHVGVPPVDAFTGHVDVFHATDMELPRPSVRIPLVWTVHGLSYLARPDLMAPGYAERATGYVRMAVRRCAHFIAVSQHTADLLQERWPEVRGRVSVIPLGVGAEFSPDGARSSLVTGPYILFVGAVAPVKNVRTLLKAYELLRDRGLPHRLVLAGSVDEGYWSQIRPRAYESDVIRTGHLDQDSPALAELYRGASVFAFPSYSEGWTSPPLEAMASGVPVVASNVSSLPETVGDAALQVNPDDAEALAHQMERLIEDAGLRESLVERGRLWVSQFTWERMALATMQVYEMLAG
ncbi:MAG: glycosyltransferase family 4 protein [Candidatus Xenobia bacterium]